MSRRAGSCFPAGGVCSVSAEGLAGRQQTLPTRFGSFLSSDLRSESWWRGTVRWLISPAPPGSQTPAPGVLSISPGEGMSTFPGLYRSHPPKGRREGEQERVLGGKDYLKALSSNADSWIWEEITISMWQNAIFLCITWFSKLSHRKKKTILSTTVYKEDILGHLLSDFVSIEKSVLT